MTVRNARNPITPVAHKLEQLGYPFVQTEALVAPGRRHERADVLAWGAREGEIRPQIVVEVKTAQSTASTQQVLEQLSRLSMLSGASECYLYSEDEWYKANPTFTALDKVSGPKPHPVPDRPLVFPRRLAAEVAAQAMWSAADGLRNEGMWNSPARLIAEAVRLLPRHEHLQFGSPWPLLEAATKILGRHVELGIREDVAQAMATLLDAHNGDHVLDPFCGIGGCLWGVLDKAARDGVSLQVVGVDINQGAVEAARHLAEVLHGDISFHVGDSLDQELPRSDRVVTVPVWALRLRGPLPLRMGNSVRDGEVVMLDRALNTLKPGGRLVAHVSRRLLYNGGATSEFRAWVANTYAVRAVIGLPPGLAAGTAISSAFLVIDRSAPTPSTLVADLHDDWAKHLAPGSEIVAAVTQQADEDGNRH